LAIPLLLIEPEATTAAFMAQLLTEADYAVSLAPSGKEGLIIAWRDLPEVIVIELNLPDLDGLEIVRRLRKDTRTERRTIIALTSRNQPEEAMAALDAGLSYYILKQADAVDVLLRYLQRTRQEPRPATGRGAPPTLGHLVVFLSAKGGVGTSSVCLNVASQMAHLAPDRPMVVVDLVLPIGSLAQITGVQSTHTLLTLTQMDSSDLRADFLRRELPVTRPWGFQVLPGCASPREAMQIQPDRLGPLIQTLRATFGTVIIDIGRNLSRLSMFVMAQADQAVMVMSPDAAVAAQTRSVLGFLAEVGIRAERVLLVSNRALGVEDVTGPPLESVLGRPIDRALPHMRSNLTLSNNMHAPLALRFPDESATLAMNDIATAVMERLGRLGVMVSQSPAESA
jgi:Flp pilus assembly CpaE family ATPase